MSQIVNGKKNHLAAIFP